MDQKLKWNKLSPCNLCSLNPTMPDFPFYFVIFFFHTDDNLNSCYGIGSAEFFFNFDSITQLKISVFLKAVLF